MRGFGAVDRDVDAAAGRRARFLAVLHQP